MCECEGEIKEKTPAEIEGKKYIGVKSSQKLGKKFSKMWRNIKIKLKKLIKKEKERGKKDLSSSHYLIMSANFSTVFLTLYVVSLP